MCCQNHELLEQNRSLVGDVFVLIAKLSNAHARNGYGFDSRLTRFKRETEKVLRSDW